jgi:hypothetical protein
MASNSNYLAKILSWVDKIGSKVASEAPFFARNGV